jgi:20S proteasome subunit beta 7
LLESCMKVLFYRDCRTINKYNIAKVTKSGVEISKPYVLPTKWDYKRFVNPHLNE